MPGKQSRARRHAKRRGIDIGTPTIDAAAGAVHTPKRTVDERLKSAERELLKVCCAVDAVQAMFDALAAQIGADKHVAFVRAVRAAIEAATDAVTIATVEAGVSQAIARAVTARVQWATEPEADPDEAAASVEAPAIV